jgi:hypothetical protein
MQFFVNFRSRVDLQSDSQLHTTFSGGPMRAIFFGLVVMFLACSSPGVLVSAQEGHPLTGSWVGDWGPNQNDRNPVLIVMGWNGQITGTINPGTDNITIKSGTLDPNGWALRFEAEGRDRSGRTLNYVIEGKINNIAMANRNITGTWRHQTARGDFKITRQ